MAPPPEVRFLPGIGPQRARLLGSIGIVTAEDVLYHMPRCLAPAPAECTDGQLPRGEAIQIRARIDKVSYRPFGRRRVLECIAKDAGDSAIRIRFFNAAYLRDKLPVGEWFLFEGKTDTKQANCLNHPRFSHLQFGAADERASRSGCEVAYSLPDGIGARQWTALVAHCLEETLPALGDPAGLLAAGAWQAMLQALHQPTSPEGFEHARQELALRELVALALSLASRRKQFTAHQGQAWQWSDKIDARARQRLPFALTPGQEDALAEIRRDLQAVQPMYRLLQGDVGSGKTALAFLAALAVVADGAQVALLAPTAVLAEQHHHFFTTCLDGSHVRLGLLTGGSGSGERQALLAAAADGTCDILIGTHALLEPDIRFARAGLFIIDEQHKFGVDQRRQLFAKGDERADLLVLTATPIPRTLALTAFGDLAVSRIDGKPPGRAAVTTELVIYDPHHLTAAISEALQAGGQAYVITALRRESDKVAAQDVDSVAAIIQAAAPEISLAVLHGALPEADKVAGLRAFKQGRVQVLVSTIVVEVGVDVPEANLIAILDADRFGLAQLHQLRGRIGRGALPGRCLLYTAAGVNRDRLDILTETDDGLRIAEADLSQRGPGEFLGKRQHGLPELRYADLQTDLALLQRAHELVRTDKLTASQQQALARRFPTSASPAPD